MRVFTEHLKEVLLYILMVMGVDYEWNGMNNRTNREHNQNYHTKICHFGIPAKI